MAPPLAVDMISALTMEVLEQLTAVAVQLTIQIGGFRKIKMEMHRTYCMVHTVREDVIGRFQKDQLPACGGELFPVHRNIAGALVISDGCSVAVGLTFFRKGTEPTFQSAEFCGMAHSCDM